MVGGVSDVRTCKVTVTCQSCYFSIRTSTIIWEILVLKIISVLIIQGDLFLYFSASFTV